MRKLDKRAISILVIATFLISMIPLVSVSASPDVAVTGTSAYYEWATEEVKVDLYSLHVTFPLDVSDSGIDVIATPTVPILLSAITEIKFWEYVVTPGGDAGYTNPPPGDIEIATGITLYLDMNTDGVFNMADDAQIVLECPKNDPLVLTNIDTWDERDAFIDGYTGFDKGGAQLGLPSGDITYWVGSAYSGYNVLSVGLVLGWGNYGNYEGYLDDITVNGVTYPLTIDVPESEDFSIDYVTPGNVEYDDTLTVIGSGVTAGTPVNIYWDYASGTLAYLLNTTDGNPDGTFECEFDVPSDVIGDHYIWAKDVSTGETVSWGPLEMVPRIKLSPSSGLVGDEVTIKGYGFNDEANFSALTFGAYAITEEPEKVETDEDGYFEYSFDVPEDATYDTYPVTATDFYGESASKDFVLGASITLDPEEGPTGSKVEVKGRGYTEDATISFTIDGTITVHVVDDDEVKVKSDGTFSAEIIIPGMGDVDEYEIAATESGNFKGPGYEDFDVLGVQELKVDPTYGTPGATITVTGSNFTQIADTEVTIMIGAQILATAETESDGTFEDTFISPAIEFKTYDIVATDEDYGIVADDAFKVGLIVLIINPESGEAGTKVSLTGIGFAAGDYNVTFTSSDGTLTELYEEYGSGVSIGEAIADPFWIPNVEPGTYHLTITDTDENELSRTFMVTATSEVVLDPAVAPNEYNVSIEGYNFADYEDEVDFVIYNVTADGEVDLEEDMEVLMDPGEDAAVTDDDGNFTAYWIVLDDEILSIGDYTMNVTGPKGLLVQVPFSVVVARVSVAPRKAEFDRGDRIQFDIHNDFKLLDSYIKIYDPYDTLYWKTEPFADDWWLRVEGLYTVPYYRQTAAENPMELQGDAPMGAWLYIFYDVDDEQLMNGTFSVGPSTAAQVDEKLGEIWESMEGLTDDIAGITDDFAEEMAGMSADFADDMAGMSDDFADDIAGLTEGINDATQAANEATSAVDDLEGSLSDMEDAMGDLSDIASDTADNTQAALDAANDAVEAAQESQQSTQGLTTLVYGAIAASLIAALAAIVSLMQISKRIAG